MAIVDRMMALAGRQFRLSVQLTRANGADFRKLLDELQSTRAEWEAVRIELEDHIREHGC